MTTSLSLPVFTLLALSMLHVPSVFAQQPTAAPPPMASLPLVQQPSSEPAPIEVPYQQTVTIDTPGASRVLSVNPAVVEARIRAPGVVELHALAFGRTFIHIWTESGRATRPVHVVQPVTKSQTPAQQRLAAEELASHLVFEYNNHYRTSRRGPTIKRTSENTTTQFDHNVRGKMETPYGGVSGQVGFQRFNQLSSLSTWSAGLSDGHVGPVQRFDVGIGDTVAGYSDLTLPVGSVRGTSVRYYQFSPYVADAFYGQQRLGFSPGTLPGNESNSEITFSGASLQDTGRPWTWGLNYAGASGAHRVETQSNQAASGETWYWFSRNSAMGAQVGRTQENAYGYRLKSAWSGSRGNLNTTYRNVSQRYENLLGRSGDQGQRGLVVNSTFLPGRRLRLHEFLDVYKDTLFANPAEPDALNTDVEVGTEVTLTERVRWNSTYGRRKLLGRLFPTDTNSFTTGFRYRIGSFPLLSNGSLFSDYRYRDLRSVSSPNSDSRAHTVQLGLSAPLWEYFSWQVSQQWTFLEDLFSGDRTMPKETSAGVNYTQRLKWLPMTLRGGFNFSTASNAASANSFISDESRWSLDAGARYDMTPDAQAFIDGRFLRRSQRASGRDYEIAFETGIRYFFDTGLSWQPGATLSGIVFQDLNGNGKPEAGEAGLSKVKVTAGAKREAVTDAAGRFYLGRVRGRHVPVAVDLSTIPEGYVSTSPNALELDLAKPPPIPLLFGFVAQAEVRARVFIDANGDGRYDATDVPLEEIRVRFEDEKTVATDRSGWVFFRGISPGTHAVTLNVDDLGAGYVPSTAVSQQCTVAEGQAGLVDFPIAAERSIAGRVYVDENRNTRYDNERVLSNVAICLDDGRRVKTREDGRYLLKNVSAGLHRISLNCGEQLPGYLLLNSTPQTVEVPPQPVRLDMVDFRLGESTAMLQDITSDVLHARQQRKREKAMALALIQAGHGKRRTPSAVAGSPQQSTTDLKSAKIPQRAALPPTPTQTVMDHRAQTVTIDVVVDVQHSSD